MSPGVSENESPTLGEIARTLGDFRSEFRTTVRELVRRDVYEAQFGGLERRVGGLEQAQKEAADSAKIQRRQYKNLVMASLGTGAVSLLISLLLSWVARSP